MSANSSPFQVFAPFHTTKQDQSVRYPLSSITIPLTRGRIIILPLDSFLYEHVEKKTIGQFYVENTLYRNIRLPMTLKIWMLT